jgi:hypothetical protein
MRKRVKIGAIATGITALCLLGLYLGIARPYNENMAKYNEYSMDLINTHTKTYGQKAENWDSAGLEEWTLNTKVMMCLDRYMAENQPFALAVTACKQEAILP